MMTKRKRESEGGTLLIHEGERDGNIDNKRSRTESESHDESCFFSTVTDDSGYSTTSSSGLDSQESSKWGQEDTDVSSTVSSESTSGCPVAADTDRVRVLRPHKNDILLGRGRKLTSHPGNISFRNLIQGRKEDYILAASKADKSAIVGEVITMVQGFEPPGRFLEKDSESSNNYWVEVGKAKMVEKTRQALRDGACKVRADIKKQMGIMHSRKERKHTLSSSQNQALLDQMEAEQLKDETEMAIHKFKKLQDIPPPQISAPLPLAPSATTRHLHIHVHHRRTTCPTSRAPSPQVLQLHHTAAPSCQVATTHQPLKSSTAQTAQPILQSIMLLHKQPTTPWVPPQLPLRLMPQLGITTGTDSTSLLERILLAPAERKCAPTTMPFAPQHRAGAPLYSNMQRVPKSQSQSDQAPPRHPRKRESSVANESDEEIVSKVLANFRKGG